MPSGFATALALAGGAVGGWGKGELENIKTTRAEKLRQLELDRTERLQKLSIDAQATEGDKSRAVQREQIQATKDTAAATLKLQDTISKREQTGENTRLGTKIEADKALAKIAADNALLLNAKPVLMEDPADRSKNILKIMKADGTEIVYRGADGKVQTLAQTTDDTDQQKNIKALVAMGVDQEDAVNRVLPLAKNSNNYQEAKRAYFDTMVEGASTMKNLTDEDQLRIGELAGEMAARDFPGENPAAGAAGAAAVAPGATDVPSSATETTTQPPPARPSGASDETLIRQVQMGVRDGTLDAAQAKEWLKAWRVDPDKMQRAGI